MNNEPIHTSKSIYDTRVENELGATINLNDESDFCCIVIIVAQASVV